MKVLKSVLASIFTLFCITTGLFTLDIIADNDAPLSAQELQVLEQKKKYLDLIVLFDNSETVADSYRPVSYMLATALSQKTAPIFASGNIVRNCCVWQQQHKQVFDQVKQAVVTDYKTAIEKSKDICAQTSRNALNTFSPYTAVVLSLVDYNDWDVFKHKDNNFFLFIPKNYSDRHAEPGSNNKIKDCGFNSDQLQKINNPSAQALLDIIPVGINKSGDEVTSLISMLVPQKKLSSAEKPNVLQMWSIYILGHGGYGTMRKKDLTYEVSKAEGLLPIIEQQIKFVAAHEGMEGLIKHMQGELAVAKKGLDDYKQRLLLVQNLAEDAIVPGSAQIAGIPFDDFARILSFFENDIYTSFLHYTTCFGGGENKTFVSDTLSKIQASFIVSADGINDRVNKGYAFQFNPSKDNTTFIMSSVNFVNFFNLLNAFFGDTTVFISMQSTKQQLQKDPIATILRNIEPIESLDFNQPTVRIPSVGIFSPLSVDKSVKILTNSIAKAYEFEDKVISYMDPEIKAVVLYPKQLGVTLKIKPDINIISPTQQKNSTEGNIHTLKKVVCNESLIDVLSDFILSNRTVYKTIFYVKDLECLNYPNSGLEADQRQQLMIKNMIIVIQGINTLDIDVAFIHNNKEYAYGFLIDQSTAGESLHNVSKNVLRNILSQKIMVNTTAGKFYYNLIVKKIGIIDTSFEVQQPGSHKKIFFVQKLDGLEKALAPEQIEQEKAWIIKNNKPATTFTNTLNRYKTELSGLIEEINKISATDLNQKDRGELLQKAEVIKKRIEEELNPVAKPSIRVEEQVQSRNREREQRRAAQKQQAAQVVPEEKKEVPQVVQPSTSPSQSIEEQVQGRNRAREQRRAAQKQQVQQVMPEEIKEVPQVVQPSTPSGTPIEEQVQSRNRAREQRRAAQKQQVGNQ